MKCERTFNRKSAVNKYIVNNEKSLIKIKSTIIKYMVNNIP